jgi:aryl-alcohol dehydrogenase-like predicted oxidoreductase
MKAIRLGQTGLSVSALGFGGIPIQRLSEQEAVEVVRHALDLGITFLDTANAYTTSEERIGKAIHGRREGLVLATKTQARDVQGVAQHLALSSINFTASAATRTTRK